MRQPLVIVLLGITVRLLALSSLPAAVAGGQPPVAEVLLEWSTGEVYAHGHRLAPPFRAHVRSDTLYVNDWPYLPHRRIPTRERPTFNTAPSREATLRHQLGVRAYEVGKPFKNMEDRLRVMAAVYRADSLVSQVKTESSGLEVTWKNGRKLVVHVHVDDWGAAQPRTRSFREQCKGAIHELTRSRGSTIAFGFGYLEVKNDDWVFEELERKLAKGEVMSDEETKRLGLSASPTAEDIRRIART